MKKFLMLALIAVFGIFMAGNAMALMYTPSQADIDTFYQVTPGLLTGPDTSPITVGPTGLFDVTISDEGGGWGDVQIGHSATIEGPGSAFYSGSWADLTGYSTYELLISNTSTTNDWFMANVYINTGYTDSPWNETDEYYQNTWTWVAPGSTAHLVLDLSGIDSSELAHISSLGFNIGTNVGEGDYFGGDIDAMANPVPEPSTMLLFGAGLVGLFGLGRKKFFKRSQDGNRKPDP